jgi:glutaredoxin
MFCQRMRLMLWLRRVPARWINIWKDPAAAEFVRSVANGNETVPTVIIDGEAVVNPPPRRVVAAARGAAG